MACSRSCTGHGWLFSHTENVGYFWEKDRIISLRKNGKMVGEWTDFTSFLLEEIAVVEKQMQEKVPGDVKIL